MKFYTFEISHAFESKYGGGGEFIKRVRVAKF